MPTAKITFILAAAVLLSSASTAPVPAASASSASPSAAASAVPLVQISDVRDGGCLTVMSGDDRDRLPVAIDDCTPDMPDDKWRRPNTKVTTYRSKFNDACLTARGHYVEPATAPCNGSTAQKWIRRPAPGGVRLESFRHRGGCIGRISGGQGVDGDVNLVPCAGASVWR
ncbi:MULTISPECIES: RICIN domain-containing protein [Streptomyces]|uniref:RICIN domain-containing protein n=1 Tax=Streptomyces sp. SYP-A7185 TaxID=3040076 RepID=UPI0038F7BFB3